MADIGGTNSRASYFVNRTDTEPVENIELKTSMFNSLEEFLRFFVKGLGKGLELKNVDVVVCIASMVVANVAQTSANFDWELSDGNKIREVFGFNSVTLFNDFKACGYALLGLGTDDLIPLGDSPDFEFDLSKEGSKYMLVGPGTGLGVCSILVKLA